MSALYALGTAVSAVMVAIVGRLVDRHGPRRMLVAVAGALGVACFGMSFAGGPLTLLLGFAALRALGQGSLPVTGTILAAQWFIRHRGRAMSLLGLGFAASNALLPPLARALTDAFGWRTAYMVLGIMVWVLIIPAALLIVRDRPEDMGLLPDGAVAPQNEQAPRTAGSQKIRHKVFSSSMFWALALPLTAAPFVATALVFHQVSILAERGLGAGVAAAIFTPFAAAVAAGTALAGFLADRLGPRKLLLLSHLLLLLGLAQLALVSSPVSAAVYAVILGGASGMTGVISGVTWAHYYGREGLGRVQGSASTVLISAAAVAPLPLAALRQFSGSYTLGLLAMASVPILAGTIVLLSRPRPVHSV